jgi:3'-phosphoadenosine 5'-phosphosulfate (PAPS) 3'-phosphatase
MDLETLTELLGGVKQIAQAADAAVAREAGCRVTDLDGRELSYNPLAGLTRPGFIVAPAGMELTPRAR